MNWFKENPFLAGLVAAAVIAGAAISFMVLQSWTAYTAASDSYTAAVTALHQLQNKVPFPSEANLKVAQTAVSDYSNKITQLRSNLSKMELPLDTTIAPQQFQDGLRAAVNDLKDRAAANNVKLPANFYLGFDTYQTQVPTDVAAPFLNRQLAVINALAVRLVDLKVQSIDSLVRQPLPQEALGAATAKAPDAGKVLEKFPVEVSFTSEQSKFRVAFNSLLGSEQFILVRALGLQNTASQAPTRGGAETATPTPNPFATGQPGSPDAKTSLQVILGRELVQATLRLELFDFAEPPAAKN